MSSVSLSPFVVGELDLGIRSFLVTNGWTRGTYDPEVRSSTTLLHRSRFIMDSVGLGNTLAILRYFFNLYFLSYLFIVTHV